MPEWFLNLDGGILLWLQEAVRNAVLTPLFTLYTHLGDSGLMWIALSVLLLCFKKTRKAGAAGLMALLLSLSADHSHVILTLPDEIDLSGLLPEWSFGFVACQHQLRGMARVINAGRALRLARMRGAGRLVLEIADAQIPPNNGRFAVAFAPGRENAVSRTDDPPDIRLGIESLTGLLLGRHDVQDIPWLPDVQMLCSPERASPVFYKKPMFISQFF